MYTLKLVAITFFHSANNDANLILICNFLAGIQEKLGILNNGEVFSVFCYDAQQQDELAFSVNDKLTILRKGDEAEREWWWAKNE